MRQSFPILDTRNKSQGRIHWLTTPVIIISTITLTPPLLNRKPQDNQAEAKAEIVQRGAEAEEIIDEPIIPKHDSYMPDVERNEAGDKKQDKKILRMNIRRA